MTSGPSDPRSSTQRQVRRAPVEVLQKGARIYDRIGNVTWLGTIVCGLLGIWLTDWRWIATAVVFGFAWGTSHMVLDVIETELERRYREAVE